jgi:D-alanine-D-alanine ligase-like ATP-grasp enzyme
MAANFANRANGESKLIYCENDPGAVEVAGYVPKAKPYSYLPSLDSRKMRIPGELNRLNASGAVIMAMTLGIDEATAVTAALNAQPCDRRLQLVGEERGITVYDDYAHHPTEIRSSIQAIRSRHPDARLIIAYQPHLYTRTQKHLDEFAPAFAGADLVILTDIYPARESPIPGISSALIVERLEAVGADCRYVPSRHLLPRFVESIAKSGDVVVGMGAGNIEFFADDFVLELKRRGELRVCVMFGGESVEREVSICSGMIAASALKSKGYAVTTFDPTDALLSTRDVSPLVGPERPDIVFLALHGTGAEDGRIQGMLDLLHLPYTGSGLRAGALAMDKAATKRMLDDAGVPTPRGVVLRDGDETPNFAVPCVVKPNAQGSTIGLSFVRCASDLPAAIAKALKYHSEALIEELVEGVEISVPVLCDEALPVVEIRPEGGSYDFAAKYTVGGRSPKTTRCEPIRWSVPKTSAEPT